MSESRAQPLVLDRIGQIAVPVTDVERAVRFYRDTLGMRFLFQAASASKEDRTSSPRCLITSSGWPSFAIRTTTSWR